jgi:hypothetical protein
VKRSGEVKSLKDAKFRKTIKQLQKLRDFGVPQVWLLEAFIVEAGFAPTSRDMMSLEVRNSVEGKLAQIRATDFGYATLPIEQIPAYAEASTGILWPTETVKRANTNPLRPPFSRLVSAVDEYARKARATDMKSVVTYCYRCRNLTAIDRRGPYVCANCKVPFI